MAGNIGKNIVEKPMVGDGYYSLQNVLFGYNLMSILQLINLLYHRLS